uniref:Uncharacterized protein n=1 Tax=Gossypium raimondii TaxID=29730 RepID=A0A0D2T4X4_GOSRA|nr:hypothetical protein B456_011G093600 [Gossypium raimondii]
MVTIKFETLRMWKKETIGEFYAKLCDLSNQVFALGNEYSNSKLRFFIKVTSIEEAKDIDSMRIDELIRSLQTFEINLDESRRSRSKGEKKLQEQIALLTKVFNKAFEKQARKKKKLEIVKNFT